MKFNTNTAKIITRIVIVVIVMVIILIIILIKWSKRFLCRRYTRLYYLIFSPVSCIYGIYNDNSLHVVQFFESKSGIAVRTYSARSSRKQGSIIKVGY